MICELTYSLKKKSRHNIKTFKAWMVAFLLLFGAISVPCFFYQVKAAPVIIDKDSFGSWEDNFEDKTGIETWDNLELTEEGIHLKDFFYDDFTGLLGSSPDPIKWDLLDDGYILKIDFNRLKSSADPPDRTWVNEMIQTKFDFSSNHTLTWRHLLYTVTGGMYYHFFMLNGSDDSTLLGISQNNMGEYGIYNWVTASGTLIDNSVSGWHDYKIIYSNGSIEFYYDDVLKYTYDFGVSSVKYQFGARIFHPAEVAIYTDYVLISSNITSGNLTSIPISVPNGKTWDSLAIDKTEDEIGNQVNVTILDGATYQPIPGFDNLTGTEIDISGIDAEIYPTIRLKAHFSGNGSATPFLYGWKVSWFDTIPPETPSGLTVNDPFTGYSLILSWDSNSEDDITTYVLYCSTDNSTFYWLANVTADTLSFTHYGLKTGTTYFYKISGADEIPNQSPTSEVVEGIPDIDTDRDGIGNIIDDDDDNDGIPDPSDPYPLNPVNDMEITIDFINTTVNNIQSDLEKLNITELVNILNYLNQTLPVKFDDLSTQLFNVENNLSTELGDINLSLSADIQNLLVSVTNDIIDLNVSLSDQLLNLLVTMTNDHQALEDWLDIVLNQIDTNLTVTKNTLSNQLSDFETYVTDFNNNLQSDVDDISYNLQLHDKETGQNHTTIIDMLENIRSVRLQDMKTMLIDLAENLSVHNQSIANDILGVVNDIEEFEENSSNKLEEIDSTLDNLQKLEDILADLEELDDEVETVQEEENEIQEKVDFVDILLILIVILLFVNIILTLVVGRGRKTSAPPPQVPQDENSQGEKYAPPTTQINEPLDKYEKEEPIEEKREGQEFPPPPPSGRVH